VWLLTIQIGNLTPSDTILPSASYFHYKSYILAKYVLFVNRKATEISVTARLAKSA
jgi:hypothetical protein